jgi:hypothetical protein
VARCGYYLAEGGPMFIICSFYSSRPLAGVPALLPAGATAIVKEYQIEYEYYCYQGYCKNREYHNIVFCLKRPEFRARVMATKVS